MLNRKVSKIFQLSIVVLFFSVLFLASIQNVSAKSINGTLNGRACKAGKYLYYSYNAGGTRDGIIRLDTKTGKRKIIVRNDISDSNWTNGYSNLVVKGKYIYATWDKYAGSGGSRTYIYRIAKDGSSSQKLACGREMVIVGKRIYYIKCRIEDDGFEGVTVDVGRASMNLDGSDKRSEKKNKFIWKKTGCITLAEYKQNKLNVGKFMYYASSDGKKLVRANKSGKKTRIFKTTGKWRISYIEVYDNYVLVQCDNNSIAKNRVYFIKNDGSHKKFLKQWGQAE